MKAIQTATTLCILAFYLIGCRPTEKEDPKATNEDNLEAVLNGPSLAVSVDVSTHVRFENQTRSPLAIKLGSTAEKIEPGSIVFIPEEYNDKDRFVRVKIAQQKEGEWRMVYESRWPLSEKWVESYVVEETTSGKLKFFGTRDPIAGIKSTSAPQRQTLTGDEPRRRVILEKK